MNSRLSELGSLCSSNSLDDRAQHGRNETMLNPLNASAPDSAGAELADVAPDEEGFMAPFFHEVAVIKSRLAYLKRQTDKLSKAQLDLARATSQAEEATLSSRTERIMSDTSAASKFVSSALKRIKMETDVMEQQERNGPVCEVSSETRIRRNMVFGLSNNLTRHIEEYHAITARMQTLAADKVRRQFAIIAGPGHDPGALDGVESVDDLQVMIQEQLIGAQQRECLMGAVSSIEEKHREVRKIEASLVDLHALFVDLGMLVDAQGERINQIDKNVMCAHTSIKRGVDLLLEARAKQKAARKKACCLGLFFLVLLCVILGPTLASSTEGA
jgi:t-SNARE complex subunit (syntaxin)